jgi:hypothetical protein
VSSFQIKGRPYNSIEIKGRPFNSIEKGMSRTFMDALIHIEMNPNEESRILNPITLIHSNKSQ